LYQLIYSDLWGGTYDDGRDTANGGSPGIDIVSSKGTSVYAIADGTVVQASYKFGIGNSVTIKHKYNGSYIYSSYSHLDEFYVVVGDTVTE
jgi:murein DD-endopeptidase MepM/ murein hydrolase activator NlpD